MTAEHIKSSINRLRRRLDDLQAFDPNGVADRSDPQIDALEAAIDQSLAETFGQDTPEYDRYRGARTLDTASINLVYRTPLPEIIEGLIRGKARAIALLEQAIRSLEEKLADMGASEDPSAKTLRAYEGLDLHREIAQAASQLYTDGHYANAVEASVKALNALVRLRSGLEIDGVPLMQQAFSPKNPILKFNGLKDQSDHDEQLGFMSMFSGAVSGLRNPRAHGFINDDAERALEFIAFVSLLAKLLDGAKK
jgi:uncharacterized protein (TIGR02391 family)